MYLISRFDFNCQVFNWYRNNGRMDCFSFQIFLIKALWSKCSLSLLLSTFNFQAFVWSKFWKAQVDVPMTLSISELDKMFQLFQAFKFRFLLGRSLYLRYLIQCTEQSFFFFSFSNNAVPGYSYWYFQCLVLCSLFNLKNFC